MMSKRFFVLVGFFAAQRFLLGDIYHFLPIVPLLFAAKWVSKSPKQASVFVMMALFFTSDLGSEVYSITIAEVRDATYFAAIGLLILLNSLHLRRWAAIKLLSLVILVLVTTAIYSLEGSHAWDSAAATRDILILFCIFVCLTSDREEQFDLQPLYYASLGFLASEIVNLVLFFERSTHAYMSFSSLKTFVIFPLFYRLYMDKKFTYFSYMLIVPLLLVLLAYNSKMFLVSLSFGLLLVGLIKLWYRPSLVWRALFGVSLLFVLMQVTSVLYSDTEGNRILEFLRVMMYSSDLLVELEYLEPVRVQQHYLFFSRGAMEIIFGNGIGAGINDTSGQLASVANETAFTAREMREGRYFNFHDIWIDFGLRFGLVTVVFFVFHLIRTILQPDNWALGIMFFMILINATFSISGVLMAALFYKVVLQQPVTREPGPLRPRLKYQPF